MANQTTRHTGTGAAGEQARAAQASGQHQALTRPADDQRVAQALDHVGLEDQGDVVEDQLRDRRGSGVPAPDDMRSDDSDDGRDQRR